MKKIAIIGTAGIPAKYGGFETLVEYLTKESGNQFEYTVYCSSKFYNKQENMYNNAKLVYVPLDANGVQSIPYDIIGMLHSIRYADVLLILGVSGSLFLPILKLFFRKSIIINIDGLEWKREKWSNLGRKFLKLSEKFAARFATHVVADNQVIADYVATEYGLKGNLIPYGSDHTKQVDITDITYNKYPFLKEPYAFKVCRIEPENNIAMILDAFSKAKTPLIIIGNWNNSPYGISQREKYSSFKHIHLLDPIYDQNSLDQFRSNCALYIHGHSAGGTNPSLVEAMYLGLPIIAFGINYNRETTLNQAIYFNNSDELVSILNSIRLDVLKENAKSMKQIADKKYTWKKIAEQYSKLFYLEK